MLPGTACPPRWRFLFWSHNLALSLASTAGDGVSDISIGWLVQYWGCNLILIWKWYEKVKVRTLPKPLSSHYDRLDLRIDYEGQKVKVKVKVRTLPQLLFSHYERLDLRIDKGQRVDSFLRQHTIWNRLFSFRSDCFSQVCTGYWNNLSLVFKEYILLNFFFKKSASLSDYTN